jgi:PAS domain S-box-containing protein
MRKSYGSYRMLILAALVGPALLFAAMAWWSWVREDREARAVATRIGDLLHEQAERVIDADELLLAQISDRLTPLTWPEIVARERELQGFLETTIQRVDGISGAFIADADGVIRILSLRDPALASNYPPSPADLRDRPFFKAAREGAAMALRGPFVEPSTGRTFLRLVRRLDDANGFFRGIAVLTISPRNFEEFWKTIASPGDAVSLASDDGTVLVRSPEIDLRAQGQLARYSATLRARLRSSESGVVDTVSVIDGIARITVYRKLQDYPVYVVYGVDKRNVLHDWYATVAAFGALAVAAAGALLLTALVVIRRARGEAEALARLESSAVAIRREQQFSELLAESSADGIIGVDKEFRCSVWNRAMEVITDIPRERALGENIFAARPDLVGTPAEKAWRAALEGSRSSLHNRGIRWAKSGRKGRYDVDFAPLYSPDRSVIGALAFVRDITERQRMEEQLRQAQKMEAVGQLTGGVAHDFNNLLTIILGNLDRLSDRLEALSGGDVDAEAKRLAGAACRAAERGALLTRRLLAFSRRQPLEPTPVDPNKLVAGMSELLRRTLGEGVATETILAGGIWRTLADPNQLENAILNLAVNARDAMARGGKLTIETANAFLDDDYALQHEDVNPGQHVMIAVSDTGIGMTKEVADKAFEPFFTTKEVGQGTGLGLSQVYGFVRQSGGHVKLYTEPGDGTTVKIYLPRLLAEETVRETPPAALAPVVSTARGELILVVEDDADVRAFSTDALIELGYRVIGAADGETALRLVESEPEISLMFTDIGLPGGLNGRQVADAARRIRPSLRVLFTTGYARNAIVHQGRLDPGVDLLAKPFSRSVLGSKIRQVLSQPQSLDATP